MKNPKRIVTTTIINILRFKLSEFYIIFYLYETKILQYTWKSAVRREKKKDKKRKEKEKKWVGFSRVALRTGLAASKKTEA